MGGVGKCKGMLISPGVSVLMPAVRDSQDDKVGAFGDDPANPKYLLTDSYFGYRFADSV
jgi:hypothetical protein